MRNGNTNRHGISLLGGDAGPCVWPGCPKARLRDVTAPLCYAHLQIAATMYDEYEDKGRERRQARMQTYADEWQSGTLDKVVDDLLKPTPILDDPEPDPVVYYLELNGQIKIGWTKNLAKRMKDYPPGALLAIEPGTQIDERRIHRMFDAHRTYGREWFAPVPSIKHHIALVKEKHGEPDAQVGPKPVTIPQRREPQYIGKPLRAGTIGRPLRG